ncbi:MAG: F0F1 ATP synthase subunit A [Microscillaceae bacterium]|jgi:F-type H+-transporting ATPase subunit a|nr:F0F1 ATP synthase subunit A [Microscillaceae bacterium]
MRVFTIERFLKSFPINLVALILLGLPLCAWASGGEEEGEHKKFNPAELIMHHVGDAHEWHFATWGEGKEAVHITLPLPVILYTDHGFDVFMSSEFHHAKMVEHEHNGKKHHFQELKRGENTYLRSHEDKITLAGHGGTLYDFSITKNVASLFLSVTIMLLVFFSVAKGYKKNQGKAPSGIQSFFEPIILFVRDDIAKPSIGAKHEKYLPYLLTVFFFIWFNNLLGLFPGGANLTGNIAVTLSLAVMTFLITNLSGNRNYWGHIFSPPGVPAALLPIIVPIEIIGIFTKPFALTVRLFANITAGHIIILSLLSLIFIFQSAIVGVVSAAFSVALTFLELLVAILQAFIFTLLSAMYIGAAVEEHHHDHEEEHAHH